MPHHRHDLPLIRSIKELDVALLNRAIAPFESDSSQPLLSTAGNTGYRLGGEMTNEENLVQELQQLYRRLCDAETARRNAGGGRTVFTPTRMREILNSSAAMIISPTLMPNATIEMQLGEVVAPYLNLTGSLSTCPPLTSIDAAPRLKAIIAAYVCMTRCNDMDMTIEEVRQYLMQLVTHKRAQEVRKSASKNNVVPVTVDGDKHKSAAHQVSTLVVQSSGAVAGSDESTATATVNDDGESDCEVNIYPGERGSGKKIVLEVRKPSTITIDISRGPTGPSRKRRPIDADDK